MAIAALFQTSLSPSSTFKLGTALLQLILISTYRQNCVKTLAVAINSQTQCLNIANNAILHVSPALVGLLRAALHAILQIIEKK
jgi:hypothetical protein